MKAAKNGSGKIQCLQCSRLWKANHQKSEEKTINQLHLTKTKSSQLTKRGKYGFAISSRSPHVFLSTRMTETKKCYNLSSPAPHKKGRNHPKKWFSCGRKMWFSWVFLRGLKFQAPADWQIISVTRWTLSLLRKPYTDTMFVKNPC